MMTARERHELRSKYCPSNIRVLFIGESPPAGGTFFYQGDSNLYKHTKKAFQRVYNQVWHEPVYFLSFFCDLGCYLDDICLDPINDLSRHDRNGKIAENRPELNERIKKAQPQAIICVKKSIESDVKQCIGETGIQNCKSFSLPFPACSWQRKYQDQLVELLEEFRKAGILR